jgi:hypothetical protein
MHGSSAAGNLNSKPLGGDHRSSRAFALPKSKDARVLENAITLTNLDRRPYFFVARSCFTDFWNHRAR